MNSSWNIRFALLASLAFAMVAPALYDEAKKNSRTMIRMKNDWKRLFAFE